MQLSTYEAVWSRSRKAGDEYCDLKNYVLLYHTNCLFFFLALHLSLEFVLYYF